MLEKKERKEATREKGVIRRRPLDSQPNYLNASKNEIIRKLTPQRMTTGSFWRQIECKQISNLTMTKIVVKA